MSAPRSSIVVAIDRDDEIAGLEPGRRTPGPFASTAATSTPRGVSMPRLAARSGVRLCNSAPSHGRRGAPPLAAAAATARTRLDGMAKPMPLDAPDGDTIMRLMPMRRPLHVDQRAAGIARIDGGVGLDEVLILGRTAGHARERRDDAAGHRLADAERIADGEHQVADLDRVGIGEGDASAGRRRRR